MRDSQHEGQTVSDGNGGVAYLAKTVMARLVAREGGSDRRLSESVVMLLTDAMIDPDPAAYEALRPMLKKARVTTVDLADQYFPEIARRLGCDWAEDRRSFVEVSIGVARMQAVLRDIGAEWISEDGEGPSLGEVLVVLPDGEQHSFGAMVLTGQLRRRGVSVRLQLGPNETELRNLMADRRFDGALVSVSTVEKLEFCRRIVRTLKGATGGALPVVVGGAILLQGVDAKAATGADAATSDLSEALAVMGLGARASGPSE